MSEKDGCMRTEDGEGRPCRAQEAVQKGHNSNKKEQAQARVVVSAGYHRWRYNMTNLFPLKPPSSLTTTTSTSPTSNFYQNGSPRHLRQRAIQRR